MCLERLGEIALEIGVRRCVVCRVLASGHLRAETEHAIEEIADVLSEVRVVPLEQRGVIEVSILSERDCAKEVIAKNVRTELRGNLQGIDAVLERLRHLVAIDRKKAMR